MNTSAPIIQKNYNLLLYLMPVLEKMPRKQKFLIAERIQNKVMDNHEALIKAYFSKDKTAKQQILQELNISLEQLRFIIRLSKDTELISFKQYEHISKLINEIGAMNGGWLKTL